VVTLGGVSEVNEYRKDQIEGVWFLAEGGGSRTRAKLAIVRMGGGGGAGWIRVGRGTLDVGPHRSQLLFHLDAKKDTSNRGWRLSHNSALVLSPKFSLWKPYWAIKNNPKLAAHSTWTWDWWGGRAGAS